MPHKRFYVRVKLHLHALTCPGVWLCSHGYMEATVKTLGYYFRTGAMDPHFPMLCHDQFTMEGYFKNSSSLEELRKLLAAEQLEITLWQNGRRLAYFVGQLVDVVQPTVPRLSCAHSGNVQLLMKATPAFPGILAPKVELSAQVTTDDRQFRKSSVGDIRSLEDKDALIAIDRPGNRHIDSRCLSRLELRRKQQTVCHAKETNCYLAGCSCAKSMSTTSYSPIQNRRLSNSSSLISSNSFTMSQDSSASDCHHSCETADIVSDADEHQRNCNICQAYSRVFDRLKNHNIK